MDGGEDSLTERTRNQHTVSPCGGIHKKSIGLDGDLEGVAGPEGQCLLAGPLLLDELGVGQSGGGKRQDKGDRSS